GLLSTNVRLPDLVRRVKQFDLRGSINLGDTEPASRKVFGWYACERTHVGCVKLFDARNLESKERCGSHRLNAFLAVSQYQLGRVIDHFESHTLLGKQRDDAVEVGGRARQPVDFAHQQSVAITQ